MDFDFEEQEGADTASPFRQQSISRPLSPRLSKCMEAEAIQTDSFRGGVLQFTVLPSGKVGQVKLQKSGKVSRGLIKCVRRVFAGRQFSPFSGSARSVRIPVQVSN